MYTFETAKAKATRIAGKTGIALTLATLLTNAAFATGEADFASVVSPVIGLLNSLLGPVLGVVLAIGSIYCVFLGVGFAKAEEPQEREKAKTHLKNAIIGFVLIFVLILFLNKGVNILVSWVNSNAGTSITLAK